MKNPFFTEDELAGLRAGGAVEARGGEARDLQWLREQNRPIYLLGCGASAYGVLSALKGMEIRGFIDNDPTKWGTEFYGKPVDSFERAREGIRSENALVVISVLKERIERQLAQQCRDAGLEYIEWVKCLPCLETRSSLSELAENENILGIPDLLADDESRETFRGVVRYRTTLLAKDLPPILENQYFIDEIPPRFLRDFVDGGAYNGDTLRAFLERRQDDFDSYHAFEPLPRFSERLLDYAKADPRIHVYPEGLAGFTGETSFLENDAGSALDENGTLTVRVVKLDDAVGGGRVGFVKMDIEGAELDALAGAEKTIRSQAPVLAVCLYHRVEHLWEIPLWIHRLGMGYRLLIRHHLRGIAETVCYALPE